MKNDKGNSIGIEQRNDRKLATAKRRGGSFQLRGSISECLHLCEQTNSQYFTRAKAEITTCGKPWFCSFLTPGEEIPKGTDDKLTIISGTMMSGICSWGGRGKCEGDNPCDVTRHYLASTRKPMILLVTEDLIYGVRGSKSRLEGPNTVCGEPVAPVTASATSRCMQIRLPEGEGEVREGGRREAERGEMEIGLLTTGGEISRRPSTVLGGRRGGSDNLPSSKQTIRPYLLALSGRPHVNEPVEPDCGAVELQHSEQFSGSGDNRLLCLRCFWNDPRKLYPDFGKLRGYFQVWKASNLQKDITNLQYSRL
ncbi:hypothetical protein J6590_008130 [Homalodisca vitripennis]|nr:hypothetical protein J6590_008130 [Homalodisca vitripennis]